MTRFSFVLMEHCQGGDIMHAHLAVSFSGTVNLRLPSHRAKQFVTDMNQAPNHSAEIVDTDFGGFTTVCIRRHDAKLLSNLA